MFIKYRVLLTVLLALMTNLALGEPTRENKLSLVFAANMPEITKSKKLGYAKLASLLEQSRQEDEFTIFIFGGGSLGPSPLSSLDRGSHIIDILNTLEPDLMTIDKREFSYFEDELTLRSYEAAFPFVSTNLYDPLNKGNLEGINTNLLINKGGLHIGIISILDEEVVTEYLLQRANIEEPREVINQQIKQLQRKGADIIVMIYSKHKDYYEPLIESNKIAFALRLASTSDIATPQENMLRTFTVTDKDPVIRLNISWQADSPHKVSVEESKVDFDSLIAHRTTSLLIDEYNMRLNRLLNQSIGRTSTTFNTQRQLVRTQEVAFGNFIADALKEATKADIALVNGGIIRGDKAYQAQSVITRGDIARELPFRSHIATATITGQQLLLALENGLSEVESAKGRFPQVAGMKFRYSMKHPAGSRIQDISINDQPLQPTKQYKLATSDYLLKGGDGYTTLLMTQDKSVTTLDTPLLSDVVIRAIQSQQVISPKIEERIVRLDE